MSRGKRQMRPIPMKEPRLPRNEIYFLIQMSRSEKDLSRGGHLPPPLPPPVRALLARPPPSFPPVCHSRNQGKKERKKRISPRMRATSAKIMESSPSRVSCADTPEGNDGCASDVH